MHLGFRPCTSPISLTDQTAFVAFEFTASVGRFHETRELALASRPLASGGSRIRPLNFAFPPPRRRDCLSGRAAPADAPRGRRQAGGCGRRRGRRQVRLAARHCRGLWFVCDRSVTVPFRCVPPPRAVLPNPRVLHADPTRETEHFPYWSPLPAGLYVPTSDVDLVVMDTKTDVQTGLKALANLLSRKGVAKSLQVSSWVCWPRPRQCGAASSHVCC
jgi:hypothetical protein